MCARFTIILTPFGFVTIYDFDCAVIINNFSPRYNVAPTQVIPVVKDLDSKKVELMRWGLIPNWAKDPAIGTKLINARAETLQEKPSFKYAFQKRRCVILADGFYEWQKMPGKLPSIPHYFTLKEQKPFVFAGLWETWTPQSGSPIQSCTIITCPPNEVVAPIHDRMPVILNPEAANRWLDQTPLSQLQSLLSPYPGHEMRVVQVGTKVNNPSIESPDLVQPV